MTNINDDIFDQLIERMMTQPEELGEASVRDADQRQTAEEIELAAASAMLATMQPVREPLPESVRERVLKDAGKYVQGPVARPVTDIASRRPVTVIEPAPQSNSRWFGGLGWAAAAALLVALLTNQPAQVPVSPSDTSAQVADAQAPALTPAAQREALLRRPGSMTVRWGESDIDGFDGVTGDVVWNNNEQTGFMRFVNMPANAPGVLQYQLWIVDPERDANPVDGGVFNITASNGEVLIPIDAKLDILSPAAFAITREQPGGVVVSEGPLVLVAAI
ncbi:MAG: anti-sigma factor [Pseudomonadota bacterium]